MIPCMYLILIMKGDIAAAQLFTFEVKVKLS